MSNLNIQKVFDVSQVYKVKDGVSLDQVKAAVAKNQRNELVVQNDSGTYLLVGKKLAFAEDAFTVSGFRHDERTGKELKDQPTKFVQLPETDAQVELGDLKGKLVYKEFEEGINWGHVTGGIGGAMAGMIGAMTIAEKIGMDGGGTAAPFIPKDPIGALGGLGLAGLGAVAGGTAGAIGLGRLVGWAREKRNADKYQAKIETVAAPLQPGSWKASSGPSIIEKMKSGLKKD
ncbi:MAG: hypothetical protein ACAI44_03555 [Candidatus Sericytochromatia bacterium]